MIELIFSFINFMVFTVIVKGIIAHALADYILKYSKAWIAKSPARQDHFDALVAQLQTKHST